MLKRERIARAATRAAGVSRMRDKRAHVIRSAKLEVDADMGRRPYAGEDRRNVRNDAGAPAAEAPVITVAPVIAGTVAIGNSIAITPPTYTGDAGTTTYTVKRGGVAIAGLEDVSEAVAEAYVEVAADVYPDLTVTATVTNASGSDSADSNAIRFSPVSYLGSACWTHLRADLGVTKDGSDNVSLWEDQSATGLDVAAGTAPLWVASSTGSQNAIRFAAASSQYLRNTDATVRNPPNTYFVVVAPSGAANRSILDAGALTAREAVRIRSTGDCALFAGANVNDGNTATGARGICTVFDGASSAIYRDNFTTGVSVNPGAQATAGLTVGGNLALSEFMEGDISEIVALAASASAAQRANFAAYFNNRYGLSIT